MEVEFQNTRKDYIDSFKIAIKNRFRNNVIFPFSLFVVALYFAFIEHYGVIGYFLSLVCCVIVIVLIGYVMPLVITVVKFNRLTAKDDLYKLKRKLTISDEGIRTQSEKHNLLRNWESVKGIKSNERFVYIVLADKKSILLPIRHFSSQVEVANFIGLVESHIIETRSSSKSPTPLNYTAASKAFSQKSKTPYLLGILCIIPIFGAFVGLGLLIYGIFVYKEKWLTLIGAGGIALSFLIFSLMKPDSKTMQRGLADVDTIQLNSLVKEIEFYKIQNGAYPDSLQQLDIKNSFTNTSDALLNGKKNNLFNYHKIGKKYTLFSSGIDQTPNTSDDIYPSIDTTRTGLIIPMVKH